MSHCMTCHRKGDWQPVHSDGSEAGGTLQEGGRIRGVGKVSGHCTERMDWQLHQLHRYLCIIMLVLG